MLGFTEPFPRTLLDMLTWRWRNRFNTSPARALLPKGASQWSSSKQMNRSMSLSSGALLCAREPNSITWRGCKAEKLFPSLIVCESTGQGLDQSFELLLRHGLRHVFQFNRTIADLGFDPDFAPFAAQRPRL